MRDYQMRNVYTYTSSNDFMGMLLIITIKLYKIIIQNYVNK